MSGHKQEQISKRKQHQQHTSLQFAPGSPVGAPRAEWVPLEGFIQFWAELAQQVTHPESLRVIGTAFLAFSFEASAHASYTHGWHSLWRSNPDVVARAVKQALGDLHEAWENWQMLSSPQLETFRKEEELTSGQVQAVAMQIAEHLMRTQLLEQSVRIEQGLTRQQRYVQEISVRNVSPVPPHSPEGEIPTIGAGAEEEPQGDQRQEEEGR
jgi:hypothetical protein